MKLLLALALAACCIGVRGVSVIPDSEFCLPQSSAVLPIQGHMKNAAELNLCNDTSETLDVAFSKALAKQIVVNAPTLDDCKLSAIEEVSCSTHSKRISFKFSTKVTCGDGCDNLKDDQVALQSIIQKKKDVLSVIRIKPKPKAVFSLLNKSVVIRYFKGRKDANYLSLGCAIPTVRTLGLKDKFPLCECPEDCAGEEKDVCSLSPETGVCRAIFPKFFYNSTSKQCEGFIYGGCGGNKNNFETQAECEKSCADKQCPKGKVLQDCGTACPKTCDNKDELIPCTTQCVKGCFCPAGTVELGDKCVPPEECPTAEPPTTQCPKGKVFQDCGTACPKTCKNKSPSICTLQCVQGCFCPDGTVELGDKCVAPEECPTAEPPTTQCPKGKVFLDCGTACPKTCKNKDQEIACTRQCVIGCFCPSGMVESGETCVNPDECK